MRITGKPYAIDTQQPRSTTSVPYSADRAATVTFLVITCRATRNALIGIKHLTDEELKDIRPKCEVRAKAEPVGP